MKLSPKDKVLNLLLGQGYACAHLNLNYLYCQISTITSIQPYSNPIPLLHPVLSLCIIYPTAGSEETSLPEQLPSVRDKIAEVEGAAKATQRVCDVA